MKRNISITVTHAPDRQRWTVQGYTYPYRAMFHNAGLDWNPQLVSWEYTGEHLPLAVQGVVIDLTYCPLTNAERVAYFKRLAYGDLVPE